MNVCINNNDSQEAIKLYHEYEGNGHDHGLIDNELCHMLAIAHALI